MNNELQSALTWFCKLLFQEDLEKCLTMEDRDNEEDKKMILKEKEESQSYLLNVNEVGIISAFYQNQFDFFVCCNPNSNWGIQWKITNVKLNLWLFVSESVQLQWRHVPAGERPADPQTGPADHGTETDEQGRHSVHPHSG